MPNLEFGVNVLRGVNWCTLENALSASRSPVVYANNCSCSSTNVGNFRSIGNSVPIFVSLPKLAQTTSVSVAAHETPSVAEE